MNAVSAASPAVSPGSAVSTPLRQGDFSDRLSPMLVKELRQGMRSPVFIWGLIGMNLLLAIVLWLMVENPEDNDLTEAFWFVICGVVCVLLPMRAGNALSDELRGGTIDTLMLTRLSGWRITMGKWIAVAAQQVLIMVTVLPYLIVRYFAGGVNVPNELTWLGLFLLLGIATAALLTGLSWLKHFLLRAALVAGTAWGVGALCMEVAEDLARGYLQKNPLVELYEEFGGWGLVMTVAALVHACYFALDIGAAKVSAAVENRSTIRRLAGLGALGIYTSGAATAWNPAASRINHDQLALALIFTAGTLVLLSWQALSERVANFEPVMQPFVRRGWIGRLLGRWLYPGWPSGLLFTGLLCCLGLATAWIAVESRRDHLVPLSHGQSREMWMGCTILLALAGTLPVPLVVYRLIFKRFLPWNAAVYLLMLGLTIAVPLLLLSLCEAADNAHWLIPGCVFPGMGTIIPQYLWSDSDRLLDQTLTPERKLFWSMQTAAVVTAVSAVVWWLAGLVLALRALRETGAVERRVLEELREEKAEKAKETTAAVLSA